MHILIFEGIATSGKSTVIDGLKDKLAGKKVVVFGESDTHIPIMDERSELHLAFFEELIGRALASGADVVIFDRLYLTQAFRAGARVGDYAAVERQLLEQDTLTIFLEVDDDAITGRLHAAMEHRDPSWGAYVRSKGDSVEAAATMYAAQQYAMRQFAKASLLPSQTYNTTQHHYDAVAADIVNRLK